MKIQLSSQDDRTVRVALDAAPVLNPAPASLEKLGLYEVMTFNNRLRQLVADRRPTMELQQAAIEHGMTEFRRAALVKVAQGLTSMEEVLSEVPGEFLGLED